MSLDQFELAMKSVASFPHQSPSCKKGRRRLLGIIGGEPTLHPKFPEIVDIMCKYVPDRNMRGLWTSRHVDTYQHPKWGSLKDQVVKLLGPHPTWEMKGKSSDYDCGYLNNNTHDYDQGVYCEHAPLTITSKEAEPNAKARWNKIVGCKYQNEWSGTIVPWPDGRVVGFFCEVAAHLCLVLSQKQLDGSIDSTYDVGMDVTSVTDGKLWWQHPLWFESNSQGVQQPKGVYARQILTSCETCGGCIDMRPRRDGDETDDVSPAMLAKLVQIGSPRVKRGEIVLHELKDIPALKVNSPGYTPLRYLNTNDNKPFHKIVTELQADYDAALNPEEPDGEET